MKSLWVLAAVLCMALAGCSGSSPATTSASTPDSGTASQQGIVTPVKSTPGTGSTSAGPSQPGSGAPGQNRAPVGSIHSNVATGSTPLVADFTLDGKDPDGDAITWTLDVDHDKKADANGTTLPATGNHTFTAEGAYNVTFTVSDGKLATTYWVIVTATAPPVTKPQPVVFTGHIDAPDPLAYGSSACFMAIFDGITPHDTLGNQHEFPGFLDHWAYAFDKPGLVAEFWDMRDSNNPAITGGGSSGEVPENSTVAFVCGNTQAAVNVDYALTITPP